MYYYNSKYTYRLLKCVQGWADDGDAISAVNDFLTNGIQALMEEACDCKGDYAEN